LKQAKTISVNPWQQPQTTWRQKSSRKNLLLVVAPKRYAREVRRLNPDYIRSILFGFEDSLVSTTGVIAGVSAGSGDPKVILLAAGVTVIVEALSMGSGQFLSERAVHQMDRKHSDSLLIGAGLMFSSYFSAGFIPLLPVMLLPFPVSVYVSISSAFIGLFVLGYIKGKVVSTKPLRSGLEILLIGGAATVLGLLAGWFFHTA
jgi:VIT1/CCC1 family predicted Fe2+/Mn2+ transporter